MIAASRKASQHKSTKKKRTAGELQEASEQADLLTAQEIQEITKQSKFYSADDGFNIPELHPFFNLSIKLQMLILDLYADEVDNCLDYIEKHAPTYKPYTD